jgi:hypothetical protein
MFIDGLRANDLPIKIPITAITWVEARGRSQTWVHVPEEMFRVDRPMAAVLEEIERKARTLYGR